MIKCEICKQEFKNNLGGDLTKHLKDKHNLFIEDYYILINLKGVEPKCQCGLCNERPVFRRGKFSKFALGHNSFKWREKKHIELFGKPKCQNPECENIVKFYRGKPRKYCCQKCSNDTELSHWNQEKIKKTVRKKYGVNNVFQSNEIKRKIKKTIQEKYNVEYIGQSEKIKKKRKFNNIKKYGTEFPQSLPKFKEKKKKTTLKKYGVEHFSKTKKFKEIASKNMCNYNKNINTNHKIRYYKNTELYYQSMYEYRFLEYCKKHDLLQYVTNSPTFKYLNPSIGKWHIPDFRFKENYIIEIKSLYWLKRQGGWDLINKKKESIENLGYKYILILEENYDDFLKICIEK